MNCVAVSVSSRGILFSYTFLPIDRSALVAAVASRAAAAIAAHRLILLC
jgi:hypothetical protein